MARQINLTLHIGLQKTGTTLIQRSLRKLAPEMREKGTIYIDRLDMLALDHLRGWSAFVKNKPELRHDFMSGMRELADQRNSGRWKKARHILISNESLVGTHSPNYRRPFRPNAEAAIQDLIETFEPKSTRLLLYVRRQDRLIESAYMQRIHAGKSYSFGKFLKQFDEGPIMDYGNLASRLEALETVTEVITRPFETIGSGAVPFVTDFLRAAGMKNIDVISLDEMEQSNPSYTEPAYQAALTINRLVRKMHVRAEVRAFLKRLFPVEDYPKPVFFNDEQRQQCLDLYRDSNEEFFRKYHPELPHDVYSTDAATKQLATYLA